MSYTVKGTYLGSCSCAGICPCPADGKPTSANGECRGVTVFDIKKGNLNDVDLSGVAFAFYNFFPSNLTSGNWKVGIVVNDTASSDQVKALESILSGNEGGPFAEFAPLIGEFIGTETGKVSIAGSKLSVGGKSEVSFEPLLGPDGKTPATIKNAPFGFAPEYTIGTTKGKSDGFGLGFQPNYGETAEFEFSSEQAEGAAKGRA